MAIQRGRSEGDTACGNRRRPSNLTAARKWRSWVADDIPEGWFVNLGIGIPTAVRRSRPARPRGHLSFRKRHPRHGPAPDKDNIEPWLINAGKQYITLRAGGIYLPSRRQFRDDPRRPSGPLRPRRVSGRRNGDIANWATSENDTAPAVGGAMDLAAGAKRLWVLMEHTTKDGTPKLVTKCSYPLTAQSCGQTGLHQSRRG